MRLSNSSTRLTNKAFVHQGSKEAVEGERCPSADTEGAQELPELVLKVYL